VGAKKDVEEDDDEEEDMNEMNATTADDTTGTRRNNIGKNELSKISVDEYKDNGNRAFLTSDNN